MQNQGNATSTDPTTHFPLQNLAMSLSTPYSAAAQRGLDNFAVLGPKPVGDSPTDEYILVNALALAEQRGLNHNQALNDLHAVGFFDA